MTLTLTVQRETAGQGELVTRVHVVGRFQFREVHHIFPKYYGIKLKNILSFFLGNKFDFILTIIYTDRKLFINNLRRSQNCWIAQDQADIFIVEQVVSLKISFNNKQLTLA